MQRGIKSPMAQAMKKRNLPLNKWLRKNGVSIQQLADDLGIAYRTAWVAAHGKRPVSYKTGEAIHRYTKKVVPVSSLCSVKK